MARPQSTSAPRKPIAAASPKTPVSPAAPPGASRPPSTDDHLIPVSPTGAAGQLHPSTPAAARSSAESELAMTAPDAVRVIKLALSTADLDTRLETAWRVLDKARVGGPSSAGGGLPAEIGPVLGEALRGAFAGLAAGLGLKTAEAVEKNVTPSGEPQE